jgi:hypothetical protein
MARRADVTEMFRQDPDIGYEDVVATLREGGFDPDHFHVVRIEHKYVPGKEVWVVNNDGDLMIRMHEHTRHLRVVGDAVTSFDDDCVYRDVSTERPGLKGLVRVVADEWHPR